MKLESWIDEPSTTAARVLSLRLEGGQVGDLARREARGSDDDRGVSGIARAGSVLRDARSLSPRPSLFPGMDLYATEAEAAGELSVQWHVDGEAEEEDEDEEVAAQRLASPHLSFSPKCSDDPERSAHRRARAALLVLVLLVLLRRPGNPCMAQHLHLDPSNISEDVGGQ